MQKSFFTIEQIQKYRKYPALDWNKKIADKN